VSDRYTLGPLVMDGSILRSDRSAFVTRFSVTEENDVISNFNRLSVTFQVNFPVFSMGANTPVRIIMSDLRGYNLNNGYIPLDGRDALSVAKTGYGNWSAAVGQMEFRQGVVMGNCLSLDSLDRCALIVPGIFDYTSQADHRFSFVIKNTDVQISFQIYPKLKVESAEATTPLMSATSRALSAANERPRFLASSLMASSDVRQATNTLTVVFETNIAMYEGSTVTVRGLDNSASASGTLELFGPQAEHFTCGFSQVVGQIVLTVRVGVVIAANTMNEVSFRLINPPQMQTQRAILMKAFIIGPPVRQGCASPMLVRQYGLGILIDFSPVVNSGVFQAQDSLTFETAALGESTTVSSAVNTITLTLVPKVDLRIGSVITLTNVDSPVKANSNLRISGPNGALFGNTGNWRYQFGVGSLVLTTTQVITEYQVVVVTFKLRNRVCYGATCVGKDVTISANALRVGTEVPAQLLFENQIADGKIFGAGAHLSWITKTVSQGSVVNSAYNRLVFTLRPNAPLYGGTKIRFEGLYGSMTRTCRSCPEEPPFYDRIPQLGCSADCLECAPELLASDPRTTFTPCIPVFTNNNVQHPTFVRNSEFVADDDMSLTRDFGGILGLTIAPGQKMSELQDTVVVIHLENSEEEVYRTECSTVPPPDDWNPERSCLRVHATTTSICSEETGTIVAQETCDLLEAPDGLPTGRARRVGRAIDGSTVPIDWYRNSLPDVCSDCVRPVDLVAVQNVLAMETGLVLRDVQVPTPSLQGLPTLVEGGLAFGEYTIQLTLSNWVSGTETGSITVVKDPPPAGKGRGPLGNENAKPAVFIKGLTERRPFRDQDVLLDAVGELALCLPGAEKESLSYRWSLQCVAGACQNPINLNTAVQSALVPTLLLPKGLLRAGTEYKLVCTVSQFFLQSTAQVVVKVIFRPVVAILRGLGQSGFAPFGRTMDLSAADSFDPDGIESSANLVYSWGCSVEQVTSGANNTDARTVVVPCPEGTVFGLEGGRAVFNNTFQVLGARYFISVNITRPLVTPWVVLGSIAVTDGWYGMGSASSTVTLIAGEPVQVRAFLCDPSLRGQSTLCDKPLLRDRVSAREHVVLKADAIPTSTGIVTSYAWSGLTQALTPSMVLTGLDNQVLLIKPNIFTQGHTVRLRCTARDSNANDGFADIGFSINVPPLGGTLTVVPSNGITLETEFEIRADFWLTDPENLPLSYRFFYVAVDEFMYDMPLSRSQTQLVNTVLVQGAANASYNLDVGVEVIDSIGDYTRVIKQVPVLPIPNDPDEVHRIMSGIITGRIDRFLRLGDFVSAQSTVGAVAGTLNQVVKVCGAGQAESTQCKLRQSTRTKLFLKLQDVTARVLATATQIEDSGRVLSTLTYDPSEIDFALVRAIADYVDWSLLQARKPGARANGQVIADVYASVVDQLFAATKQIVGPLLRRSAMIGPMADEEEDVVFRSRDGAWTRQAIPVPTARNVQWQLLRQLSTLSSVSLQASVSGQISIVIIKPSFTLNSTRLASQIFEGFTAMIDGTNAMFTLPPTLFQNLEGTIPPTVEIMLALFQFEDNPLSGANGPQAAFEVRPFGSDVPLVFETARLNKVQLLMPYLEDTLTREFLPVTGQTRTPFCKVFDRQSWTWITSNLFFVEEAEEFVRMDLDLKGSHFAVSEVLADCEDEPLGPSINDQCGVCGGDDGTCSGCDGIPGTGRFKNCSGHGRCIPNEPNCQCEAFYYDIMCATFCSEATTCSGHGVCDFSTGKSCFCNTGWGTNGDQPTYPGPFCGSLLTVGSGAGAGGEDGKLSKDDIQWLLVTVVPAVAGGLVLCLCGWWCCTRKKRELSKLHRTIIEFPQPQLEIPAEERPDAIVATPDENGWTNIKLPVRAGFGYGPNSGQLVSAIAASTRTGIGKMSVQSIDRRTKLMKKQISGKNHPAKAALVGPRLYENGDAPHESDEESEDLENGEGKVSMLHINDGPDWSDPKH